MPIPFLANVLSHGIEAFPLAIPILKTLPCLVLLWLLKLYFGGASNTSERLMRSKVIMITVPSLRKPFPDAADILTGWHVRHRRRRRSRPGRSRRSDYPAHPPRPVRPLPRRPPRGSADHFEQRADPRRTGRPLLPARHTDLCDQVGGQRPAEAAGHGCPLR